MENPIFAKGSLNKNIRNVCIIAHVDHGKSTLTDALVSRAGLISKHAAGERLFTDGDKQEQDRGITIKSTSVTMEFERPIQIKNPHFNPNWPDTHQQFEEKSKLPDDECTEIFEVNLIDSPGHIDFSSEVSAALRITDGAMVVVDCLEGVRIQTETVLRQALQERVKPVLFMNKLDRVFFTLHDESDEEEVYQSFCRVIESVNVVISTHADDCMVNPTVHCANGTVGFGSALFGWGFTLETFAKMYHQRFNISVRKMMKKLWGENYWDSRHKCWSTDPMKGKRKLVRGFNLLVLRPLRQLFHAMLNKHEDKYMAFMTKNKVVVSKAVMEDATLSGKQMSKHIMGAWLPLADALLDLITRKLPSPVEAQQYRAPILYSGPQDDQFFEAIKNCDPNGPLMIYISKLVPTSDYKRFYAFGRVYSGSLEAGQQVRVHGPSYVPTEEVKIKKGSDAALANVMGINQLIGGSIARPLMSVECGGIVALTGVDSAIVKSATLTSLPTAYNFAGMKFSVHPIVRVAVDVKDAVQRPKLSEALKRLVKTEPLLEVYVSDDGEFVLAGSGELHLEVCIKSLETDFLRNVELVVSQPIVPCRETITSGSANVCSKSPNKLNRLYMRAEPMSSALADAIDDNQIDIASTGSNAAKVRGKMLVSDFKWDTPSSKKVWAFGMAGEDSQANVLVDQSSGMQWAETQSLISSSFQTNLVRGVLAQEPLRGVRFELLDGKIHGDTPHRGAKEMSSATRRAMHACQLSGTPAFLQPMYVAEIVVPSRHAAGVYSTLRQVNGEVQGTTDRNSSVTITAFVPVWKSFGFDGMLKKATQGSAFTQLSFSHWSVVPGDVFTPKSPAYEMMMAIRERKGLSLDKLPKFSDFHDKI